MILDAQTNKVFISACIFNQHPFIVKRILEALSLWNVPIEVLDYTNDIWCRDYMPIQVSNNKFIQYRYYPDYLNNDKDKIFITDPTKALKSLNIETIKTDLVIDGGNIIKCPDCVIMTDKVVYENSSYSKTHIIQQLEHLFECEIILLSWDKNERYGHTDGIIRYVDTGKLLMTNYMDYDKRKAEEWLRVLSEKFEVEVLQYHVAKPHSNNWSYINFLLTEQAIFVPIFDKEEDEQALYQIGKCFPDYSNRIIPIQLNGIVKEGGALNCITWNVKI